MSYQSSVLALPGLVAYWPLDESAGATTAADAGPNNLPLTYSPAKVSGASIVNGLSSSTQGNGTSARIFRAVPNGSPLQISSTVSFGLWVNPTALPGSGYVGLGGRANNWHIRLLSNGGINGVFQPASPTGIITPGSNHLLSIGTTYFVAVTYDENETVVYINGIPSRTTSLISTGFNTTTDTMELLDITGTWANALLSGAFVTDTLLGASDIRQLYLAGTLNTAPVEGLTYNYLYSGENATVDASSDGRGCAVCGGSMKSLEPTVSIAAGLKYHAGCYSGRKINSASVVTTQSSTMDELTTMAQKTAFDMIVAYTRRPTATAPMYFDGVRFQPTTIGDLEIPVAVSATAAILHRSAGLPKNHWLVELCKDTLYTMLLQQTATGYIPSFDFSGSQMGMILFLMRDCFDVSTYSYFRNALVAGGNAYLTSQGNGALPESQYYVNGNRELFELASYYMLFKLTGDSSWNTVYEDQYTFLTAPSPQTAQNNAIGMGLITTVTPSLADASDGKGYLAEKGGGAPGYDGDYTQLQLAVASRMYSTTNDIRYLRMCNLFYNTLMDHVNTSTWVLDATNGSRHNTILSFNNAGMATLAWRGGRSIVTTQVASQVKFLIDGYYGAQSSPSPGTYRGVNLDLQGIMIANPNWSIF